MSTFIEPGHFTANIVSERCLLAPSFNVRNRRASYRTPRIEWKTLKEYLAAPVGAAMRGRQIAVFWQSPGFRFIRLWGRLEADDLAVLLGALQADIHPGAPIHVSLIDARGLQGFHDVFQRVGDWAAVHRSAFCETVPRAAVVYAELRERLLISGSQQLVRMKYQTRSFSSGTEAITWLGCEDADDRWRVWEDFIETELGERISVRVRQYVRAHLEKAHIGDCARALGISTRSLQRLLADENRSFREITMFERVQRAKQLLLETNVKLLAVALEVGFSKIEHLNDGFIRLEGCTAAEWRAV